MKPYTLGIFGHPVASLASSKASCQMLTWGLADGFAGLEHVRTQVFPWSVDPAPAVDIAVVHTYSGNLPLVFDRIRSTGVAGLALFLEVGKPAADRSFFYGYDVPASPHTHIRMPIISGETRSVPKRRGAVLLDHMWPTPDARDSWRQCLDAIEPIRGRLDVHQIARGTELQEERPAWVRPLAAVGYPAYMAATAEFESFVVTHAGSYNHSIVDMATRGVRVVSFPGMMSPRMASDVGAVIVESAEELRDVLLSMPPLDLLERAMAQATPMEDVARIVNEWAQECL